MASASGNWRAALASTIALLVIIGPACCGASLPDDLATDLADLRESIAERSHGIDEVEQDVADIIRGVQAVVDRFDHARLLLEQAAREFDLARSQYDEASAEFQAATATFDDVAAGYRVAATALIVVAGVDLVGTSLCDSTIQTQAYRERLEEQGVDLAGQDIDHIIPRALGGPDLPTNYEVLDASVNRSLGAGGLLEKFLAAPLPFLGALAVTAAYALACR